MTEKFPPIVLAERVLGKGVHEAAINRLIELVPDAKVTVHHSRPIEGRVPETDIWRLARWGTRRDLEEMQERRQVEFRFASRAGKTTVAVRRSDDEHPIAVGFAHCCEDDPFCRAVGREMAFRRVLEILPRVVSA